MDKRIEIERKIIEKIKQNGFVVPNEDGLYEYDPLILFSVMYDLIIRGVIRRRNCDGIAYEFTDQAIVVREEE